jgi:hypothetical protein
MFSKARMADLNELIPADSGRTLVAVDGITKVLDRSRMTGNPETIPLWPQSRIPSIGKFEVEVAECMVRRLTAREKCWDEESLRQCIRPLGGEFSPGLDEIRRVPVL